MIRALGLTLALAVPAVAQQDGIVVSPLEKLEQRASPGGADDGFGGELRLRDEEFQTFEQGVTTEKSDAGTVRVLDKTTGRVSEMRIAVGDKAVAGRLEIALHECRYPVENPAADAFARLSIVDPRVSTALFQGWMLASSPALMALDHPRYDVWVTGCGLAEQETRQASPAVAAGLESPRPKARP
ncbi:DUF2155 domain-containing protein [Tropicimonas sp. S265A]|uniref:DUF2155 domain-containing protein n=1 Tax=Tropicimonas sp. S265A TaxID=3415134 RepID=UPI003C7B8629